MGTMSIGMQSNHNGCTTIVPSRLVFRYPLRSTCARRGCKYLVMAVDFIKQDPIKTILDLWHFSCSLIQSVFTLHEKAKMLHDGDLKPPNVLWKGGIVWLVDFDHAQDIEQALPFGDLVRTVLWHPNS
jgi:hypothetical protein